jgi:PhnB protein
LGVKVIDFMTDVLNAKVMWNAPTADKTGVMHACLKIGDTAVMVQDASAEHAAVPVWLHVYVEDVDHTYALALQKGATSVQAPKDEWFGDRMSSVKDSAGNTWFIATQKFLVTDTAKCPGSA